MNTILDRPDKDNRTEARARLLKRGKIVINGGYSVIDCVVLDVSSRGARLQVAPFIALPDRFEIRLAGGVPRTVEVVHRDVAALGVKFIQPAG
jgi:hypothetical protein